MTMRKLSGRLSATAHRLAGAAGALQGVVGVGCLAVGTYLLAGLGLALIVLGVFLLLGAWGRR